MQAVSSATALRNWAMVAQAGAVVEYHRGHLAHACSNGCSSARTLALLQEEAQALLAAGVVTLAQARHDNLSFSYRAIKLSSARPRAAA